MGRGFQPTEPWVAKGAARCDTWRHLFPFFGSSYFFSRSSMASRNSAACGMRVRFDSAFTASCVSGVK